MIIIQRDDSTLGCRPFGFAIKISVHNYSENALAAMPKATDKLRESIS